jgi:large subunit ribosomal protein L9
MRADGLNEFSVSIPAKAGTEGKLYGSIGTAEIASAISDAGQAVEKREVRLPEGALRELGAHEVSLHFHTDVDILITVNVVADEEDDGAV